MAYFNADTRVREKQLSSAAIGIVEFPLDPASQRSLIPYKEQTVCHPQHVEFVRFCYWAGSRQDRFADKKGQPVTKLGRPFMNHDWDA